VHLFINCVSWSWVAINESNWYIQYYWIALYQIKAKLLLRFNEKILYYSDHWADWKNIATTTTVPPYKSVPIDLTRNVWPIGIDWRLLAHGIPYHLTPMLKTLSSLISRPSTMFWWIYRVYHGFRFLKKGTWLFLGLFWPPLYRMIIFGTVFDSSKNLLWEKITTSNLIMLDYQNTDTHFIRERGNPNFFVFKETNLTLNFFMVHYFNLDLSIALLRSQFT